MKRSFARLGIYTFYGRENGTVQDVPIVHVEKHDKYSNKKNDIALLYLEHDLQITGK